MKKRLFSCEYFCNSAHIGCEDGATLPVPKTQKVNIDYEDYESSDAMPLAPCGPFPLSLGRLETSSVGEVAS